MSTTRNRAWPLIMRLYASAALSSEYASFIDRTPAAHVHERAARPRSSSEQGSEDLRATDAPC